MTSVDVCFSYGMPPTEATMKALDYVREVYGVRGIRFNEAARSVRVEYDATRLNEDTITALLRRTGLEISGKLALS
jgi:hypothetical protein